MGSNYSNFAVRLFHWVCFYGAVFLAVGYFPANADETVNTVSYLVDGSIEAFGYNPGVAQFLGEDFRQSTEPYPAVVLDAQVSNSVGAGDAVAMGSVYVFVSAETGILHAGLTGVLTQSSTREHGLGTVRLMHSTARARWQDTYVMGNNTNPHPFRGIHIEAVLILSGNLEVNASGDPRFTALGTSLAAAQLGVGLTARGSLIDPLPSAPYSGLFGEVKESTLPAFIPVRYPPMTNIPVNFFAFEGQPATLDFQLEVRASGTARTTSFYQPSKTSVFFDANFTHTMNWGGITRVTDANTGEPIPGWTITSSSGVDYAQEIRSTTASSAPMLQIQRDGGKLLVSWLAPAENYQLEVAADLGWGGVWNVVTNAPVIAGFKKVVTGLALEGEHFYRLKK